MSYYQYNLYKHTESSFIFDQINTSTGDRELLIGVDKAKPLFFEQTKVLLDSVLFLNVFKFGTLSYKGKTLRASDFVV